MSEEMTSHVISAIVDELPVGEYGEHLFAIRREIDKRMNQISLIEVSHNHDAFEELIQEHVRTLLQNTYDIRCVVTEKLWIAKYHEMLRDRFIKSFDLCDFEDSVYEDLRYYLKLEGQRVLNEFDDELIHAEYVDRFCVLRDK